jgi:ABC-type phosphate transport system substrate-binding protein
MSSFYWQVYKPATSTITLAQLNKFFETYDEAWVKKNIPDVREFLKRYFIQGQNGAAQSGYLDALNTVWGQMSIQAAAPKPEEKKEADKPAPVDNTLMYVAIGISATALFAVLITLLLPARNVL